MLGTFPPKAVRWSMDFFYPNWTNDMWRIAGMVFEGERETFCQPGQKCFDLERIKKLLDAQGIALWDTAMAVRRLKDNASDQFLEIVEPIDLVALLDAHPTIKAVVTTGTKATEVVASIAGCTLPEIGGSVDCVVGTHDVQLWRMPSSSRAYPLALERKAAAYARMFEALGCNVKLINR